MAGSKFKINYQAMIQKYTWWKDVKGRRWLVVDRFIAIKGTAKQPVYEPETVSILEELTDEPIVRPWQDIVDMIEANKFTQIKPVRP